MLAILSRPQNMYRVHGDMHSQILLQLKVSQHQGLYSLNGKTSYHQISRGLEAAGLDVILIVSLWNLTGISGALLPRRLSNVRAIGKVYTQSLAASKLHEILH